MFGLVSRESLEDLSSAILKSEIPKILEMINTFDNAGKDMSRLVFELMEHFRNLLLYHHVGDDMAALGATLEQTGIYADQKKLTDANRVLQITDQLGEMEGPPTLCAFCKNTDRTLADSLCPYCAGRASGGYPQTSQ